MFGGKSWKQGARATGADSVKLQFFLQHSPAQRAALEEALMDRSTPSSANYGKWLSGAELTEIVGAPVANLDTVIDFVRSASTDSALDVHVGRHQDMLSVTMPADAAEALLSTELFHYSHKTYTDVDIVRAGGPYHLPESVASKVSLVGDIVRLPALRESLKPVEPEVAVGADEAFNACGDRYSSFTNPAVLQERYGYPSLDVADVAKGNNIALAEFQRQYYDTSDLTAFAEQCGLDVVPKVTTNYGGNNEGTCTGFGRSPCVESLLDIEYAGAVAANIPMSVYYSSSFSLLEWAETVGDNVNAELVHSVSYGNDEIQQTSEAYMYSVNTEFAKLGAKGLTVVFASGDQGVWGRSGNTGEFNPDFPCGSPYVTSVGGTDFATKGVIGEESTWVDGGGGFSNTFGIPEWQADEVAAYLEVTDVDTKYFNATGRGYPDVSALAGQQNAYFISYKGGKFTGVGGTSAACPVFAGIVAHLNNVRLLAGGAALGFMNPWIYENGEAFNDVTSGANDAGLPSRNPVGFTATEGWDAATGYGTPNYAKLLAAL